MEKNKKTIPASNVHPLKIADGGKGIRHVFIRDFVTGANIGAYQHETGTKQKVRINIDMSVAEAGHGDKLDNVVCYDRVITGIRTILEAGHINLVETLAERIADQVLLDRRITSTRVRVEKLDAVKGAASVGVEIERQNRAP